MGFTLDQLLDETGVSDLSGMRSEKRAQVEKHDFSKLAERCRRAADATPAEQTDARQQDLVEKTAAIAIIGRTLAEIRAIEEGGSIEKVAAPASSESRIEAFIKTALDAGHDPTEIALFLEKNAGVFSKIKAAVREFGAGRSLAKAERLGVKAEAAGGKAFRQWEDHVRQAEHLSPDDQAKLISRMRIKLNDERAAKLISGSKALSNHPSGKDLKRAVDALAAAAPGAVAKPKALGVSIGGAHAGITSEQLDKLKKPAALVGAGYLGHRALSSGQSDDKKKSGVVVVNS